MEYTVSKDRNQITWLYGPSDPVRMVFPDSSKISQTAPDNSETALKSSQTLHSWLVVVGQQASFGYPILDAIMCALS